MKTKKLQRENEDWKVPKGKWRLKMEKLKQKKPCALPLQFLASFKTRLEKLAVGGPAALVALRSVSFSVYPLFEPPWEPLRVGDSVREISPKHPVYA